MVCERNVGASRYCGVSLAVQFHDVDDDKLVGRERAENLTNTTGIMKTIGIDEATQRAVRDIVANMGYK